MEQKKENRVYRAAIYVRLSKEDGDKEESESIVNQKDLIRAFLAGRQDIRICDECVDDGYSGADFDRPGFKHMMKGIETGKIDCVVVKDFSRFGRNLVEVGDYLDQVFPFLGVRFIAVNEGYDSAQGCGSTVGLDVSLRAMVHELYSRDISEKIRSVRQAKMRRGEYLCAIAFYGYRRSETGKNHLEVDPGAAEVVRRIFRMAAGGMPSVEIAAELNREGVPSPRMYRRANHTDGQRGWKTAGETTYWTRSNVARIVKDRRYTGCLVGHKRTVADLSTKRTEAVPEEEWIVAEHTHEALVTEEVFAQAQGFLRRSAGKGLTRKPYQKFRGLLKCAYCSRTLDWRNCKQPYFSCPTAGVVRDFPCKEIHLDESALEDALLTAIQVQTRLFADAAPEAGEDTERHLQDEIKACQ